MLLNVAEDHLDRHGTMEAYLAAKLQAFARQGNDDLAVVPVASSGVEDLGGCARRVCFGDEPEGRARRPGGPAVVGRRSRCSRWTRSACAGPHNRANAMAAAALALARGLRRASRCGRRCAASRGSPHRLEEVARRDGVLYVNDSKATNVASALVGAALVRRRRARDPRRAGGRGRLPRRCATGSPSAAPAST